MNKIKVTLPDSSVLEMENGWTPQDVADKIGPGLGRSVVDAKVDEVLMDLNTPLSENCSVVLFNGETDQGHDTLLHSTAHLMAQAVKELYPDAKITIGPTIENGFYYDFDVDDNFTNEDLNLIEKRMKD